MSSKTKRKISSAYRAVILIPVGVLVTLVGAGKIGELINAGESGSTFVIGAGVVSLLIGVFYAYDFFIGANKEYQKLSDYANEKEAEQERLKKKVEEMRSQKEPAVLSESDSKGIPQESLVMLKKLYDDGVLTEEEFSQKKKQLLNL